jgi:hypothetical protein
MRLRACLPEIQDSAQLTNHSMRPQVVVDLARIALADRHNCFPIQADPLEQRGM